MEQEFISIKPREQRMDKIFGAKSCDPKCGLLKNLAINELDRKKIFYALRNMVYACLIANNKEKSYQQDEDFFENYADDIMALPNITPNGLILPKFENIFAYNQLFSTVNDAFEKTEITKFIDKVQFPINIRIQTGFSNKDSAARPRASTKYHSDIWAGDPINSVLSFLAVVGEPTKISGIDFFHVENFPKKLVCLLDNYDSGHYLVDQKNKLSATFNRNGWFFSDSYLMHQTTKNQGQGIRISLDFRFIPKIKCESDGKTPFLDENKKEFFIAYKKFKEIGKSIFLYTDEKMHDGFVKKDYISGYPVKLKFK